MSDDDSGAEYSGIEAHRFAEETGQASRCQRRIAQASYVEIIVRYMLDSSPLYFLNMYVEYELQCGTTRWSVRGKYMGAVFEFGLCVTFQ